MHTSTLFSLVISLMYVYTRHAQQRSAAASAAASEGAQKIKEQKPRDPKLFGALQNKEKNIKPTPATHKDAPTRTPSRLHDAAAHARRAAARRAAGAAAHHVDSILVSEEHHNHRSVLGGGGGGGWGCDLRVQSSPSLVV
jgi:hypothetical protein